METGNRNSLKTWFRNLLLAAICALAASPALAQSWKINRGLNIGAFMPTESRKAHDGGTYLTGGARYQVETEDPTYPITGQSMDCRWMCKVSPDGKAVNCLTICAGTDKDGDLFGFRSTGANSYEAIPGTGKFSKASGGGTFETSQPDDPNMTVTRWKGTLQLK